jgi:serine/threonine-protein kinase RsbW
METGGLSGGVFYETSVDCEIKSIPVILDFVGEVLDILGFDKRFSFDVKVAVDEACTNIISYSCEGADKIDISIAKDIRDFVVAIKNYGKPFDPDTAAAPDIESPLEQRRVGGLGIFFMKQLMDKIDYEHKDGLNVLTMVKYSAMAD